MIATITIEVSDSFPIEDVRDAFRQAGDSTEWREAFAKVLAGWGIDIGSIALTIEGDK